MKLPPCVYCLFCEEVGEESARCNNADLADEAGWTSLYYQQGYLDVPLPEPGEEPCFWFVKKTE